LADLLLEIFCPFAASPVVGLDGWPVSWNVLPDAAFSHDLWESAADLLLEMFSNRRPLSSEPKCNTPADLGAAHIELTKWIMLKLRN
jgi:hypothetical protein